MEAWTWRDARTGDSGANVDDRIAATKPFARWRLGEFTQPASSATTSASPS